ncbi:MAG TPA: TerC family protein [Cyclobacteriaceae bacterium]|nr:TerC family protein [Cyclobacteriaceae bacterium]
MEHLFSTEGLVSLLTLTFLEIILGIDNVVFISIMAGRVEAKNQKKTRTVGLALALIARLMLLLAVGWLISLQNPVLTVRQFDLSFRDLILIGGGLFLIWKSVSEIHAKLEGDSHGKKEVKVLTWRGAVIQIMLIDIVFSFDSVLTAVGLVENLWIIVIAIAISLAIMLIFVNTISNFINQHPAMKLLAISFLFMIGTILVIEGLHFHVPKGYMYFSMAFAIIIEMLNMRMRKKSKPVVLKKESGVAKAG